MNFIERTSPLASVVETFGVQPFDSDTIGLVLSDVSTRRKIGFKGRGVVTWLEAQGILVPKSVYGWTRLDDGTILLRLDSDQVFLEAANGQGAIARLEKAQPSSPDNVWPILQEEAGLILAGHRSYELLLQVCGYDFRFGAAEVVMTSMAGATVTALHRVINDTPVLHIWVDCSYSVHLFGVFTDILQELGGTLVTEQDLLAALG